jgi:hypothetical protein
MFNHHSVELFKNFNFKFLNQRALFIIIGQNGVFILKMPKIYFYKLIYKNHFSFIFINNYHYQSFIKLFNVFYNRLYAYYYFRLKLKGRGYRMKRLCQNLYRFYFIKVNYIYLHVPCTVLVKLKKRRIFLISYNFGVLQTLMTDLLLIKAVTAYNRKGLLYPREMIFMKPGKKRI